jgi:heme-degrading monooxygenase HmoA
MSPLKESQVIRTVIYLNAKDGNTQALIDYFHSDKVLEHSAEVDGFIEAELFFPAVGSQIMVTATWDSEAAYQRWIDDPWRVASNERISELLEEAVGSETRGASFELLHRVTKK